MMPINAIIIRALLNYYLYYGDSFTIACPTGSGRMLNLCQVAKEIARRLTAIFLRDDAGWRPVFGGAGKFIGVTIFSSTSTSMATTAPASAQVTKPAGRDWWPS